MHHVCLLAVVTDRVVVRLRHVVFLGCMLKTKEELKDITFLGEWEELEDLYESSHS